MRRNKLIVYYEELIRKARLHVADCKYEYEKTITMNVSYFLNHGEYPEFGKKLEMNKYLDLVQAIIKQKRLENKLSCIKINETRVNLGLD